MLKPERRRPVDLVVSALIVAVVAIIGYSVWLTSPVRHTEFRPAGAPLPSPAPAVAAPESVTPAWQARSPATTTPQMSGAVVVTGNDGTVSGLNYVTGQTIWSYRRNLPLCGVIVTGDNSSALAVAAYRNSRGCGEVSTLRVPDGQRGPTRSSESDSAVTLTADDEYTLSQGSSHAETWGSNMVRGVEYGRVSAPVNPGEQPRSGCALLSSGLGSGRVAIIERCPGDKGFRLSVISATHGKDDNVQKYGSGVITTSTDVPTPRIIGIGTSSVAVYESPAAAGSGPTGAVIRRYSFDTQLLSTHAVSGPPDAPADSVPVKSAGLLTFWTGTDTVVIDSDTMRPIYQVPGTLGPGALMGADLLLPIPDGIAVLQPADGHRRRSIDVTRPGYRSTQSVELKPLGNMVIEQYGSTVHGLRPAGR